jgi:hypothetical protein
LAGHDTLVHTPPAQLAWPVIRPSAEACIVKTGAGIDKLRIASAIEANTIIIDFIDHPPLQLRGTIALKRRSSWRTEGSNLASRAWRRAGQRWRPVRWPGSAGPPPPRSPQRPDLPFLESVGYRGSAAGGSRSIAPSKRRRRELAITPLVETGTGHGHRWRRVPGSQRPWKLGQILERSDAAFHSVPSRSWLELGLA